VEANVEAALVHLEKFGGFLSAWITAWGAPKKSIFKSRTFLTPLVVALKVSRWLFALKFHRVIARTLHGEWHESRGWIGNSKLCNL